jgi:hypothetical protein
MKRGCPRRVLEDLAHISRQEKAGRYEGRSDWRRLAYDAVLSPPDERGDGNAAGVRPWAPQHSVGDGPGTSEVGLWFVCGCCHCALFVHVFFWGGGVAGG